MPPRGHFPRSTIAKKHWRLPPPKPIGRARRVRFPIRPVRGTPSRNIQLEIDASLGQIFALEHRKCAWHNLSGPRLADADFDARFPSLAAKGVLLLLEFRSETALDSTQIRT